MAWPGGTRGRLRDQAAARLDRMLADWDIPPAPGRVDAPAPRRLIVDEDLGGAGARTRWSPRALRALGVVVACCLVVVAWWWWSGRPRPVTVPLVVESSAAVLPGASATPTASPTTATVVVHVAGLVRHPGLVTLPDGARVADAVAAAGGVAGRGSAESVNLARALVDGEQIVVTGAAAAPAPATGEAGAVAAPVDLNHADATALQTLPGVGPVLAARILQWRDAHGPFRSLDELGEVPGIGDVPLERLRPFIRL